jgi:hypothetical protein
MSVTDGSLTTDGAQQSVRVVGSISTSPSGTQTVSGTVTANQGTAAVVPWLVTSGVTTSTTTLNAASAVSKGTSKDFGYAVQNISMVVTAGTGVTAGAVQLEVSQDGTNWAPIGSPISLTAAGTVAPITVTGAFRYARGAITTAITGGTVSATVMGA